MACHGHLGWMDCSTWNIEKALIVFFFFFTFFIGRWSGTRDNNIKYSWWHNYVGVSEDWWHFNNSTYRLSKRKSIIKALMIINSRVKVLLRKRWLRNSIIDLHLYCYMLSILNVSARPFLCFLHIIFVVSWCEPSHHHHHHHHGMRTSNRMIVIE